MGKYSDIVWDGKTLTVPPGLGVPGSHQLLGSDLDNLVELSGRACYDSLGAEKSRNSQDYHQHIIDVNHGSVQEHATVTAKVCGLTEASYLDLLETLLNRPGVYYDIDNQTITANLRAIREWNCHGKEVRIAIGTQLKNLAKSVAPLVMSDWEERYSTWDIKLVPADTVNSVWLSYYIHNVSRGLTHELVRHKYQTAVSQRSTRYVDESHSELIEHPLIGLFKEKYGYGDRRFEAETEQNARLAYQQTVVTLEPFLIASGVDKFTARKQARGAARGYLGNALSTELIFSASLAQWIRMLKQRATQHADAEIRLLFNEIYLDLKDRYPGQFNGCTTIDCPDGIGFELVWPKGGAV